MPDRSEGRRWVLVTVLVAVITGLVVVILMLSGVFGGGPHQRPPHGSALASPSGGGR